MFTPDYTNVVKAARNIRVQRFPLYEHGIHTPIMEQITGTKFGDLLNGDKADMREFFKHHNAFYRDMGYDTATFEVCIGSVLPGTGALGGHQEGSIKTMNDLLAYPWAEAPDIYFRQAAPLFEAFGAGLPEGMLGIGGVGNGVFELVQDLVGYMDLCYIKADDPALYAALFARVGDLIARIWARFLTEYGDLFAVCRFGDDLGFKSATLLPPDDIRLHIIPQYQKVVSLVHQHGKPFLLHSCGAIFDVMDDIIAIAGIDAKHSNEDQIAAFPVWMDRYGDRIGCFGGVDTDVICDSSHEDIVAYTENVIAKCIDRSGFAFGTGNAIASYTSAERYAKMVDTARRMRGA